MKNFNLILFSTIILFYTTAKATTHQIIVEDNEFSPSSLNVLVGDTIEWIWDNSAGSHTTTSTDIPAGAAAWDAPINSTAQTFFYVVTMPGSYDYKCTFHVALGMIGNFNATGGTGIAQETATTSFNITGINNNQVQFQYALSKSSGIHMELIDIAGNVIQQHELPYQLPGTYSEKWDVGEHPNGIYFIQFSTGYVTFVKKIILM